MFGRIDHIGVAVEDLDAAIGLYERDYGMEIVHREVVEEQGVEAVLLDVGENHVELRRPLRRPERLEGSRGGRRLGPREPRPGPLPARGIRRAQDRLLGVPRLATT